MVEEVGVQGCDDNMGSPVGEGVGGIGDVVEKLSLVDGNHVGVVLLGVGDHGRQVGDREIGVEVDMVVGSYLSTWG